MADVRSLLRNELASRKAPSQAGSSTTRPSKKRKVESNDDLVRKKLRPAGSDSAQLPQHAKTLEPPSAQAFKEEEEQEEVGVEFPPEQADTEEPATADTETAETGAQTIDEDEWAAFEREVVAPTLVRQPAVPAAVAAPTISAAPVSAAELATQQRHEKESMARTREAEAEGEREDAARFLEEEFDEMDQLEKRVRRLKEKREELRRRKTAEEQEAQAAGGAPSEVEEGEQHGGPESESDEDDEGWDDWRFR